MLKLSLLRERSEPMEVVDERGRQGERCQCVSPRAYSSHPPQRLDGKNSRVFSREFDLVLILWQMLAPILILFFQKLADLGFQNTLFREWIHWIKSISSHQVRSVIIHPSNQNKSILSCPIILKFCFVQANISWKKSMIVVITTNLKNQWSSEKFWAMLF